MSHDNVPEVSKVDTDNATNELEKMLNRYKDYPGEVINYDKDKTKASIGFKPLAMQDFNYTVTQWIK